MQRAIELVDSKVATDTDAAEPDSCTEKQDNVFLEEYLQEGDSDAAIVADPHSTRPMRFKALARMARKLGMSYCKEELKARIMAVAFHDGSAEIIDSLDGQQGYSFLQQFKLIMKGAPTRVPGREPLVYPPFHAFEAQHPTTFVVAGIIQR